MTPFSATSALSERGVNVIAIAGYLDAHTASELEQLLSTSIADGCCRIVVEFSQLDYISSAGLGVFMVFIEDVRTNGGDIKLAAMRPNVFTVFDLLGFPSLFGIYTSVDDALAAFSGAGQ